MVDENQEDNYTTPTQQNDLKVLDEFIFNADKFTRGVVPRNHEPQEVAKFLIERLDKNSELKHFVQAEKAADFYDTYEIADKFRGFLDGSESGDNEVLRSIVITRTIGRVGKPEDVDFAKSYYSKLIPKLNSQTQFEEFIKLHEVLGLGTSSAALRDKITQKIAVLEAKKDGDYSAEIESLNFQGAIEQNLNRAEKVETEKNSIIAITDRKKRISEEIKAYLAVDYGYLEYMEPWAAKRLRRETWAAQPAEQKFRNDKQPLIGEIAASFRDFLSEPDYKELPKDEKEFARVKILRAIDFFNGKISEDERDFLAMYKGEQADTLANEGFLLPKKAAQ